MGEVKRFMIGGHWDDKPLKECVLASDYDALRAENERLKAVPMKYKRMEHNAKLQTEVDALRAEAAELAAALVGAQKIINYHGWSASEQAAYDAIDAALAKHIGDK